MQVAPTIGLRVPEKVISLPSANHAVLPLSMGAPSGIPKVARLPLEVYLNAHKPTICAWKKEGAYSSSATCRKSAFMNRAAPHDDDELRRSEVGTLMPGTSRQPALALCARAAPKASKAMRPRPRALLRR